MQKYVCNDCISNAKTYSTTRNKYNDIFFNLSLSVERKRPFGLITVNAFPSSETVIGTFRVLRVFSLFLFQMAI
jgi:hypothetical protein